MIPGLKMKPPPPPPDPPKPEGMKPVRAGEPPLEYIGRNGFRLTVYPNLYIGRRYDAAGRCVDDFNGTSARDLALKLGWRP